MKKNLFLFLLMTLLTSVARADGSWVATAPSDLQTGDVVVIARTSGQYKAMSNNKGTSDPPTAVGITLNTAKTEITSTVSDNIKWTVSVDDGDFQFYASASTWLYATNTNNGVRVGINTNKVFKIDDGYLFHVGTSRYIGVYNNSDWRCYTSNTGNSNIAGQTFAFYKYVESYIANPTITFSPEAGTYTGAQNVKLSVTNAGDNYQLTYKIDNGTAQTYDANAGIDITESCTLYAILQVGDNSYNFSAEYVIQAAPNNGTFELVTDESTLKDGDRVIITNGTSGSVKAMGAQRTSNRGAVDETVVNNQISPSNNTQIITLEKTGDNWYLCVSEGQYLYAAGGNSSNHLKTAPKPSPENGNWKAAITIWKSNDNYNNVCNLIFQGAATRNVLRYNSSSSIFSCYEKDQDNIYLYKEVSTNASAAPVISVQNPVKEGDNYIGTQTIAITQANNGAIYYTTNGNAPTTSSTPYTGTFTVEPDYENGKTIKAIAVESSKDPSSVVEFTLNFTKPTTPTINPAGGEFTGETLGSTVSIAAATTITGATPEIRYSIDGNDPTTTYSAPIDLGTFETIGTSKTVKAIVVVNGVSSEVASATYTRIDEEPATIYTLVTSVDQLKNGRKYIIVGVSSNGENTKAMSAADGFSSSNRKAEDVTITGNTIKYTQEDKYTPFTLIAYGNYWLFNYDNIYLKSSSTSSNELKVDTDISNGTLATITIINDSTAIKFKANEESGYILQFNSQNGLFACYKNTQKTKLYIYGEASTTLADIERNNEVGDVVTVADDVQVVYVSGNTAYARDMEEGSSNYLTTAPEGSIDYMRFCGQQEREWAQNNWVKLDLSQLNAVVDINNNYIIKGGTLEGVVADKNQFTITVKADAQLDIEAPTTGSEYVKNVYCAANFGAAVQTSPHGKTYFLMQPKPMEIATITWSVWNGSAFYMAAPGQTLSGGTTSNMAGLTGGFSINDSLNGYSLDGLTIGEAYCFTGLIARKSGGNGAPRRAEGIQANPSGLNNNFEVFPLNLDPSDNDQIVTGVTDLNAPTAVSTTYYNAAGLPSATPHTGINIVVRQHSDGSKTVEKKLF